MIDKEVFDDSKIRTEADILAEVIVTMQRRIRGNFLVTSVIMLVLGIFVGYTILESRESQNKLEENSEQVIREAANDSKITYRFIQGERGQRGKTGSVSFITLQCTMEPVSGQDVVTASCKKSDP